MLGVEPPGDLAGVVELVVLRLGEADRERPQAARRQRGGNRHDGARIETAAEQDAHRHVGDQPEVDHLAQSPQQLFGKDFFRIRALGRIVQRPVALQADLPVLEHQGVRRRQLAQATERRPRRGDVAEREVVMNRLGVGLARHVRILQDRLRLGREPERARVLVVAERFLAQAVARGEQAPAARVPDREGEHAAQVPHARLAVLLVQAKDDLGVARRPEPMALLLEIGAQLLEVVDLAVVRDDKRSIVVRHRLVRPIAEVDHLQAPVHQPDSVPRPHARIVRASMLEGTDHAIEERPIDGRPGVE